MDDPLLSIVLPTRDGHRFLAEALASCLEQDYQPLELILVDDGSTEPRTARALEPFADNPRLRLLRLPENQGLPRALSAGFRQAHGELLTWTSDDNRFQPGALSRMARALADSEADFVYAGCQVIDQEGRPLGTMQTRPPEGLLVDNCVGACFLYRRRVYEKLGDFDPDAYLAEDYDYWLRCHRASFRMIRLDEELYDYRHHGGSLTAGEGTPRVRQAVEAVRRRRIPRPERLEAEGRRALDRGDRPAARRLLARAWLTAPLRPAPLRPLALASLPPVLLSRLLQARRR